MPTDAPPLRPGERKPLDVAINALGKPYQTALTILSLLRHCARHIDKVHLAVELPTPPEQAAKFDRLQALLPGKLIIHRPSHWHWCTPIDPARLSEDDYRLSIRYQSAWERTDKRFLLVSHNDCVYHGDAAGALLDAINGAAIAGDFGVCHKCPCHWSGRCSKERFETCRPTYRELFDDFAHARVPEGLEYGWRYHETDFNEKYRAQPWPTPLCRVNEWCCLIDLDQARPATVPLGPALPFGALTALGNYIQDNGCEWFHDVLNLGLTARDVDVFQFMSHTPGGGHGSLFNPALYRDQEARARAILRREHGLIL